MGRTDLFTPSGGTHDENSSSLLGRRGRGVVYDSSLCFAGTVERRHEQFLGPGGEITIAATSPITDWNPISANGDTTGQRQQQWPLYPHPFVTMPDTSVVVNEALLESADVVESDPMTVEYVLQDGVQWSDGTPIGVDDFVYTQAVQDPSKCADCLAAFTEGYSDIDSIEADDDGKTITMVYGEPFAEWRSLFNYILPAHIADGYGDLATSFNEGFSTNVPEFSGGPYIIEDYTDGISMTMVPNPNWYGEGPNLETITTRYITGQGEQLTALQSGEVQLVYATPTVDTMEQAQQMPNMTIQTGSTLTYYHLGMKTTGDVMSDEAPRSRPRSTWVTCVNAPSDSSLPTCRRCRAPSTSPVSRSVAKRHTRTT